MPQREEDSSNKAIDRPPRSIDTKYEIWRRPDEQSPWEHFSNAPRRARGQRMARNLIRKGFQVALIEERRNPIPVPPARTPETLGHKRPNRIAHLEGPRD